MTLCAAAILARLQPGQTLDVCSLDGSQTLKDCVYEHLVHLARAGVITAKASNSRIKYALLHVTVAEADEIVLMGAKQDGAASPGLINSQASRTVTNSTIYGQQRTFKSWEHIRGMAFAYANERLHAGASKIEASA